MAAISFGAALRSMARATPCAPAITDTTGTISWADADRLCDVAANSLLSAGVVEGDVVAVSGANSAQALLAIFAIWRIGAVPLHLHARKARAEIDALMRLGGARLAIGFDAVPDCQIATSLAALFAAPSSSRQVENKIPKWLRVGPSGGSTGRSKLIVIETPGLINPRRPWLPAMESDGVQVLPLDLMDGAGFVMATVGLATGSHIVLMERFDPVDTLRLVQNHRADWLALTPPLMLRIWKLAQDIRQGFDLSSLRAMVQFSGGAAPWLKRAWVGWLGAERVIEIYGGTDARGSTTIDGVQWLERPGSVGHPGESCEIQILAADKAPLTAGQIGDIYLRDLSGQRRFSYIGAELETLPGGWETIGDMGHVDEAGFLYIADRRKDVIRTRHGLAFPLEIEGAIEQHPEVLSCIVLGLPSPADHETIHAIIETSGSPLGVAELRAFLESRFEACKMPDTVEHSTVPLRDTAGKARRAEVRAERMASTTVARRG